MNFYEFAHEHTFFLFSLSAVILQTLVVLFKRFMDYVQGIKPDEYDDNLF